MALIVCIAGAVVGLIIGMVISWFSLPMVLRYWEARFRDPAIRLPLPAALRNERRLRALIVDIYRYVFPLVFTWVGGFAAYYLFIAE